MQALNQLQSSSTVSRNSEQNESALLKAIVDLLVQQKKQSRPLSDLGGSLPEPLRLAVKDNGGRLRSWLLKHPSHFAVTGAPGKESVTLLTQPYSGRATSVDILSGSTMPPAEEAKELLMDARSMSSKDDDDDDMSNSA